MNSPKIIIYSQHGSIRISIAVIPVSSKFKKTIRQHSYGIQIMISLIPLITIWIHLFFVPYHVLNFLGCIFIQKTSNFPSKSIHSKEGDHSLFVTVSWLCHPSSPFYVWVPSIVVPTPHAIPLIIRFVSWISCFLDLVPDWISATPPIPLPN